MQALTVKWIAEIMDIEIKIEAEQARLHPEKSKVIRFWLSKNKAKEPAGEGSVYEGMEGFKHGLAGTVVWFTRPENLRSYKAGIYNV